MKVLAPQGAFSFIMPISSAVPPYQTRCNSHLCPPLERRFIEFGTEVERRSSEGRAEEKKSRRRGREEQQKSKTSVKHLPNLPSEKTFSLKPYTPTPTPHISLSPSTRYSAFKYRPTLHQPYTNPTPLNAYLTIYQSLAALSNISPPQIVSFSPFLSAISNSLFKYHFQAPPTNIYDTIRIINFPLLIIN